MRMRFAAGLFALLGALLGAAHGPEGPAPARGRDPAVFRLALDDRPRMCVAALREGLFLAYDPLTCGLYRACGGVELRGKVYDFSQNTSRTLAPIYYSQPCMLLDVGAATAIPAGGRAEGVACGECFMFEGDGATLELPPLDLRRFDLTMLTFEERSRKGPIRVDVIGDDGAAAQTFRSTLHRDDDAAWQENAKRIAQPSQGRAVRVRFTQESGEHAKAIRRVRVFGAFRCWSARRGAEVIGVTPQWRGYRRAANDRPTLLYALRLDDGGEVEVQETPEALAVGAERAGIARRFVVRGLQDGTTLELSLAGAAKDPAYRVRGPAVVHTSRPAGGTEDEDVLEFTADGEVVLDQWWGR